MKVYRFVAKKTFWSKVTRILNMRLSTGVFILFILVILTSGGAGIYYFKNQLYPDKPLTLQNFTPVTSLPVSLTLNISSPDDNSMVFAEDLLLQGKTTPKSVVILSTNNQDILLEPNAQGDFSASIKLQKGLNLLTVNVFDNLGNSKTENRTIYYSEEKI